MEREACVLYRRYRRGGSDQVLSRGNGAGVEGTVFCRRGKRRSPAEACAARAARHAR